MKKIIAVIFALSSGVALAHGCPGEMRVIDAKLSWSTLTEPQMSTVKSLRIKGEQLHKDGQHSESMAALAEAKKLLGL